MAIGYETEKEKDSRPITSLVAVVSKIIMFRWNC